MLGFVLSKMQMLLFATGIFVVAVMFYGFISGIELKTAASTGLSLEARIIEEQLGGDTLCSFKSVSIPDRITYGVGTNQFFYDLTFTFAKEGTSNVLLMSIAEHGRESILASKKIPMNYGIVLVDPGFIAEDKPVDGYVYSSGDIGSITGLPTTNESCDSESCIRLYPRAATKGAQASAPNAFVALKEVAGGKTTMYIIPCSTLITGSTGTETGGNCIDNIRKVGCWKMKSSDESPSANETIPSCFNITVESENEESTSNNFTWEKCQEYFYGGG